MMTDDTIKYVLSSTDGKGDFITLPRKFVHGCQMVPSAFEELFFSFASDGKSYSNAYHEAENVHVKIFGKQKYSDYQSFKTQRSKKK